MTIPEGGSCAMCKHCNLIALPRGTRPGGDRPCSQVPLCGYALDASALQGVRSLMEKDSLEGKHLLDVWDKSK